MNRSILHPGDEPPSATAGQSRNRDPPVSVLSQFDSITTRLASAGACAHSLRPPSDRSRQRAEAADRGNEREVQHVPHSAYELASARSVRNPLPSCTCRHAPRRTRWNNAFIVAHQRGVASSCPLAPALCLPARNLPNSSAATASVPASSSPAALHPSGNFNTQATRVVLLTFGVPLRNLLLPCTYDRRLRRNQPKHSQGRFASRPAATMFAPFRG